MPEADLTINAPTGGLAHAYRDAVSAIIETVARHTGGRPRFGSNEDRTVIWEWELGYRMKGRAAFAAWLEREGEPGRISVGMFNLSQFEAQDLTSALNHPCNVAGQTEQLRKLLNAIRMEGASCDRPARLAEVHALLVAMETAAKADARQDFRIVNGCANKWTTVTALLSFANPRFPFIRPTNQDPKNGGAAALLFAELPWSSTPSRDRYAAYCARFDVLDGILAESGLGENPLGALGASAWLVAAHALMAAPAQQKRLARLARQGALILQGPPGIGKTWTAEHLARELAEQAAQERGGKPSVLPLDSFEETPSPTVGTVVTHFVQFHASFDYEDFVRGFRPVAGSSSVGFELRDGPFARILAAALRYPMVTFLLVVDEINRADLARVLGECIYLLDRRIPNEFVTDVLRGVRPGSVALRYQPGESVAVSELLTPTSRALFHRLCLPENVLFVGTMNTADRSTAVVDVALRRRFAFFDLKPDVNALRAFAREESGAALRPHLERVVGWLDALNGADDGVGTAPALISDARYHVGHSYFMKRAAADLEASIKYSLLPLLREYQYDRRLDRDSESVERLLADISRFPEK